MRSPITSSTSSTTLSRADSRSWTGSYGALLSIERSPAGELAFTLYTNDTSGRASTLAWQSANAIAIADRLDRLGVAGEDQAGLFAPAQFTVTWPDPARSDPIGDTAAIVGQDMLAFGMTILIFMMVIMYGTWIAMSVVEEKSSRVMEVVLNAATPFQLLTGKVLGVGAVAFSQYAAIVVTGVVALVLQDTIASTVLGSSGGAGLPEGLSIGLLLAFAAYGVLGFLLYACLFAAAGSLVSRQEDVNTAVMPLTLLSDRRLPDRDLRLDGDARHPVRLGRRAEPRAVPEPVHDARPHVGECRPAMGGPPVDRAARRDDRRRLVDRRAHLPGRRPALRATARGDGRVAAHPERRLVPSHD